MSVLADATEYFDFDSDLFREIYDLIAVKHYPVRIPPDKWPDQKLIGKAMAKGWAVPCKYYGTPPRGLEKCLWYYIFPGIPGGSAYEAIASVLLEGAVLIRKAENEKRKNTIDGIISFHESRRNNLQI